jgi:hypothetical protein
LLADDRDERVDRVDRVAAGVDAPHPAIKLEVMAVARTA